MSLFFLFRVLFLRKSGCTILRVNLPAMRERKFTKNLNIFLGGVSLFFREDRSMTDTNLLYFLKKRREAFSINCSAMKPCSFNVFCCKTFQLLFPWSFRDQHGWMLELYKRPASTIWKFWYTICLRLLVLWQTNSLPGRTVPSWES